MDSARIAKPTAGAATQRAKRRVDATRELRTQAPIAAVPSPLRQSLPPDGRPLDPVLRRRMESRFGVDFSQVRMHANADAAALAERAEANAFTVGESIVFDPVRFAPDTTQGQRLLAHELAHVVQQRRGGTPVHSGDASLESKADSAADAIVAGGVAPVQVVGASAPGLMCEPSRKKKRPRAEDFGGEEDEDFDHGHESESSRREREKKQSLARATERDQAGKSPKQVLAEDSEKKLQRIEALMEKKGANKTSKHVKDQRLNAAELALSDLPGNNKDKNLRKSRIDERQRTPDRAGGGQTQFVAGSIKLPTQDLTLPGRKKPASHARPDFSVYRIRPDGSFERVHINLKSHQLHRMTDEKAQDAARKVLYQAIGNSKHLPKGERLIISFARTPSEGIQNVIKKELFTKDTPISEIHFGHIVHRESDYPTEGRLVQDTDAKSRKRALKQEKRDADKIEAQRKRIAKRQQKADEANAAKYERARKAKLAQEARERKAKEVAERKRLREEAKKARDAAKAAKAAKPGKTTKAGKASKPAPASAAATVKTPRNRRAKASDPTPVKSATAPATSPRPPPTAKRSNEKPAATKKTYAPAGKHPAAKPARKRGAASTAVTPPTSPAGRAPAAPKVSASTPRAATAKRGKSDKGGTTSSGDLATAPPTVARVSKPRPTRSAPAPSTPATGTAEVIDAKPKPTRTAPGRAPSGGARTGATTTSPVATGVDAATQTLARPSPTAPGVPRASTAPAGKGKPAPLTSDKSKALADEAALQELRRKQEALGKRQRETIVKPALPAPLPPGQGLRAKPGAPAQGAPAKPAVTTAQAPTQPPSTKPANKPPAKAQSAPPAVASTPSAPVKSPAAPVLLVPTSPSKGKAPPPKAAVPTPPVAKKNAPPTGAAPATGANAPPAAKAAPVAPTSAPAQPKRPAVSVQSQAFFGDQVKVTVTELVGASDKPFIVTTRITVNASGSFGATSTGSNGGSGSLSASGSVTSAFSTPMSLEEKNAYLAAVSGGRGGAQPAMPLIELIANGNADQAAEIIKRAQQKAGADPATAFAQRQDGDVIEEGVDGDISGMLGGHGARGGTSVGANISASKGKGVQRTSRRVGANEEIYSVSIDERDSGGLGVSGGYGVASMGYQGKRGSSGRKGVSFRLRPGDPNYAELRAKLAAATTIEQLQELARDYPGSVAGHSSSKGETAEDDVSVGIAGFGLDMDTGSFGEEGEQFEDGRRIRTTSGGSNLGGAFTVAGQRINPSNKADSISAWVDDDNNAGAEVRTDSTEVDLTKTLQRGVDDLSAHPIATVTSIARGNKKVMQERVDTTGETLNNDSFDLIQRAAGDRNEWLKAWDKRGTSHGAAEEWEEIRQDVLAANGDRFKISQAMSKWQKGDSGRRGDVERLIGDTGIAFDFPDEIADQKPLYDNLIVSDPTAKARQFASDGDSAQALAELKAVSRQLSGLLQTIQMHAKDATEGGKYSEMQRRISDRQRDVRGLISRYSPKPAAAAKAEPLPPDFVGPPTPDQDLAAKEKALEERKEANEEISTQVPICLSNQDIEKVAFAKVEDELDDTFVNIRYCFDTLNALQPTYKEWDQAIAKLKAAYAKIGDTPDRANRFAPNRSRWDSLNKRAIKS